MSGSSKNNNLSQKFSAKDISNGSLNQITTTGFYFGSNITEVTPYIKSHKWCLINAYVSGNSASIFVIAGDAMALSIYRNGDGVYSYYPIATKSDLEKSGVCIGGIHIHSCANKSSATTKKLTPTNANSHMAGLLIVDQNNKTDVYSIGRLSGVQPLLKKSDADLPTISSGVLSVSLVAWGSIAFVSFDEFTIS